MKLTYGASLAALAMIAFATPSQAHNSTPAQIKAQFHSMMCPTAEPCHWCQWEPGQWCAAPSSSALASSCRCKSATGWQTGKIVAF